MIPTGLRHPSFIHVSNAIDPVDVVNNLILYMPLGFALAGSSLRRAFFSGLLLATAAETLQLGYVDRIPSLVDIASNTTGAMFAYLVADRWLKPRGYDARWLNIPRFLAIAGIPLAILGTIMMLVHRPQPDFSNWNPAARLAVGDEVTGGRRWDGAITALQIYPFAMTAAQIDDLAHASVSSFPGGGLVPQTITQTDFSQKLGQPLLSEEQQRSLFDALVKQGRMTLLVAAQPANVDQTGPARIVTYSQGPFARNFTLGQVRTGLTLRLRTPVTGENGTDPALYTGPVLQANRTSLIAAVYDGRVSSLYVDGKIAAHVDLKLKRPHLPQRVFKLLPEPVPLRVIELTAVETLCSSLLTLGLLALPGVPQRRAVGFFLGLLAGVAVGGTIWVFVVSSPGLGMRIVLECVAAGVMPAASIEPETVI